jgi:hypothetical protein
VNPAPAGDALTSALAAALSALEAGNIEAAAAEMKRIEAAVTELGSRAAMTPTQIELARSLHTRCATLADKTQPGVVAELLQTAVHRKAAGAYGSSI